MRPHLSAFTTAVVCRPRSSPGWFECLAVGVCLPVGQRRSAGRLCYGILAILCYGILAMPGPHAISARCVQQIFLLPRMLLDHSCMHVLAIYLHAVLLHAKLE
jgi:hypothetical protein